MPEHLMMGGVLQEESNETTRPGADRPKYFKGRPT